MLVAKIERVIRGGQTGADPSGWRAAKAAGMPTGGVMPHRFKAEDGFHPEFAELYGAIEMPTASYPARTDRNDRDSDGTIWFGDYHSKGGRATLGACRSAGRPFLLVFRGITRPSQARDWIEPKGVRILNVAGNRESTKPGIGDRVERFLGAVFPRLGHCAAGTPGR